MMCSKDSQMGQCCCVCKRKVKSSDCDNYKKDTTVAVIETDKCLVITESAPTLVSKIQEPSEIQNDVSKAESVISSRSSSNEKDEIQAKSRLTRPNNLDLNLEEEPTLQDIKEPEEEEQEPEEDALEEPKEDEEPKSVEDDNEEETPQTDCTVVSCVSRGASCTPSEIRRSLLIPPFVRPVSSVEFANATQELLSPTKVHGWGHHHKKLSNKLKNQFGESSKQDQKHRHCLQRSKSDDFTNRIVKHHSSKERKYWDDSAINNGKRKRSSGKRKKRRRHKDRRPVSAAADIPVYRVPPIAVL